MAFQEDMTVFFNTADFAVTGKIIFTDITGILSKEYVETEKIQGFKPVFTCPYSSVATIMEENGGSIRGENLVFDENTVDQKTYVIQAVQEEEDGIAKLILEDAN